MLNNLIDYYNIKGAIIKGKGILFNVNIKTSYSKCIQPFYVGRKGFYRKQLFGFLDVIFYIIEVGSTSSADIKDTNCFLGVTVSVDVIIHQLYNDISAVVKVHTAFLEFYE